MTLPRALLRGAAALVVTGALLALAAGGIPLPPFHASARADNGNGGGKGHGKDSGDGHGGDHGGGRGNGSGKGKDQGDAGDDADGNFGSGGPAGGNGAEGNGARVDSERVGGGQGHDRAVRHELVVAEDAARLTKFAQARGFRILGSEKLGALGLDVTRLQAPEGVSADDAKAMIAAAFPKAVVDVNHLYRPQASLTLPATDYPMKAVHWLPTLQACGAALRLGLIDTAIVWSTPILEGVQGKAADFLDQGMRAAPPQHGTDIATLLVGQRGFGLMPSAALYSASIFGLDSDNRPVASATSFAAALNWLASNDVSTINVSLSGPPDRLMELAVARAQQLGLHLVAAVGNDGTTDVLRYPAAYPGVVGVTAVDQKGEALAASNRGSFVALAAPGVDIWIPAQPTGGDQLVTGTSFAAPYVTAALAAFGNDVGRMLAEARDLGAPGVDPIYGHGLVHAPANCAKTATSP
jgi:Subtilase family